MKVGKLDSKMLEDIVFKNIKFKRPEVLQRPGIGEDCAGIDFGETECIMSTDPITAAISEIGRLAIHITCNDIASNGVEPLGIMLAVMLPVGTTEADVNEIMRQAGEEAEKLQVEIIGGHTEITNAVNKPVIVSTAIGKCKKGKSIKSDNISVGDLIVMTKEAGLEGMGIFATDCKDKIAPHLTLEEIKEAKAMLANTSVVKEGMIAGKIGVSGMHDVTEGGILGAVWELCQTSGLGAKVYDDKIPVSGITRKLCEKTGIDYLRLISSGCMMMIVPPEKMEALEKAMESEGIAIASIGSIAESGMILYKDGKEIPIAPPQSDELYKLVQ